MEITGVANYYFLTVNLLHLTSVGSGQSAHKVKATTDRDTAGVPGDGLPASRRDQRYVRDRSG